MAPPLVQAPQDTSTLFRQLTRRASVQQNSIVMTSSGGVFPSNPASVGLGHTGWLGRVIVGVSGTLVTGAGTPAGAWPTYPALPWSLFRRLRVFTNTNAQLVSVTGWGLYLLNRCSKRNFYWDQTLDSNYITNNATLVYNAPTAGTPAASTTYNVAGFLSIPIMTSDSMMLGGLFLQSDAIQAQLEVTPPVAADFTGTITGVTVTPTLTYTVQCEWFEQPTDLRVRPNVQFAHDIIETNMSLPSTGVNTWRLPVGNTYLKVIAMAENGSPTAGIPGASISQVGMGYAQTNFPILEPYSTHQAAAKRNYGNVLPDGAFVFDYDLGSGVAGLEEPRDFLNTSEITDFQIQATISSGLTLASPNLRVITQQLAPIGQASLQRIYGGIGG